MLTKNIIINQHTFPAKSIERFTDTNGCVQVFRIPSGTLFPAKPANNIFSRRQIWDQRAEQGYGKSIEDKFQALVEYVIVNNVKTLPLDAHRTVGEFYALWRLRCTIDEYDHLIGKKIAGLSGSKLTNEEKLNLELKHAMYTEPDGSVPKRFTRGLVMQQGIDIFMARNGHLRWFISTSGHLEFLISDNPEGEFIIPITPRSCFILGFDVPKLSPDQVRELNLNAIFRSKRYYFAKSLQKCIYA